MVAFFTQGEWLALAMVILLALVSDIVLLKLVIWLLTPERDKDESESNIGAYMEIKVLRGRRKSFVLSAHLAHNSCALPRMDMTPSKSTAQEKVSQCGAIPLR